MMLFKKIWLFLILIVMMGPVFAQKAPYPEWLNRAIFYQVYPQSYKDSNGDGIGDIKGLTQKLPYIHSIGVNAIWLNPCFASSFRDAGYDITDYYRVAPRYGTNADLEYFFQQAHRLGIKVCLDLVAGHTSIEHPWFVQSANQTNSRYKDRYIWTSSKKVNPEKFVSGKYSRDGNFQKNFFDTQPALNYGYAHPNPKNSWERPTTAAGPISMREELKAIMAFWMDKGADGFRVDMASSLIKNDTDFLETNKLWGNIRHWFTGKYPRGILVSEWSYPAQAVKAGFMMDFLIHFNAKGYPSMFFEDKGVVLRGKDPFFAKAGRGSPTEFVDSYLFQKKAIGNRGLIAVPSANHDFQRLRSGTRNSVDQLKVAFAFLLTWQSVPFIYYGDEIGMKFIDTPLPDKEGSVLPRDPKKNYIENRAGTRTPMQWSSEKNAGFSTADPLRLYLPLDPDIHRPNVAAQDKDPAALLNFVRKLIVLRKEHPALGNTGGLSVLYAQDKQYPLVYTRENGNEHFVICINPRSKPVNLTIPGFKPAKISPILIQDSRLEKLRTGTLLQMKGISFGIYQVYL
jgi:maltose alpha-D-glucosyltransferase/alpha-amylase